MCVLLRHNLVRAVVIHDLPKIDSGRKVQIGASEAKVVHAYAAEVPEVKPIPEPAKGEPAARGAKKGRVYRYDSLGIGFEIHDERVTGITLYPPSKNEER